MPICLGRQELCTCRTRSCSSCTARDTGHRAISNKKISAKIRIVQKSDECVGENYAVLALTIEVEASVLT